MQVTVWLWLDRQTGQIICPPCSRPKVHNRSVLAARGSVCDIESLLLLEGSPLFGSTRSHQLAGIYFRNELSTRYLALAACQSKAILPCLASVAVVCVDPCLSAA